MRKLLYFGFVPQIAFWAKVTDGYSHNDRYLTDAVKIPKTPLYMEVWWNKTEYYCYEDVLPSITAANVTVRFNAAIL